MSKLSAVVNIKTKKVGCVLLQAAYGGSPAVAGLFDPENWDLAPNPDHRMVNGTMEQWKKHADLMNAKVRR